MKEKLVSVESMLPRIITVNFYEHMIPISKNPGRTAEIYEISLYLGGSGTIFINDKEYKVHNGDVRFSKPGTKLISSPEYKCYTVYFDFGESNMILRNQILDNIPEYFSTDGATLHLFEKLIHSYQAYEVSQKLYSNAILMQLIFEIYQSAYSEKEYSHPVKICIEYMKNNYKENITLKKLGELSSYSHIHILRLFKTETGITPHDWLTNIRINYAKEYLESTNIKISQIADLCGFSSDSHFKILFKKTTGFTPGNYRKNINQIC